MDYFHMWKWLHYPSVWNGWLESVSSFIKLWCNINWGYKILQNFLIFEYIALTLWSYIKHKLCTDPKRVKSSTLFILSPCWNYITIWRTLIRYLLIFSFRYKLCKYYITYQQNIIIFFNHTKVFSSWEILQN